MACALLRWPVDGPATERLWLTQPARRTTPAVVTMVKGPRFVLDRGLFAPRSRTYRHPQPPDEGTMWRANGEKRRLAGVVEEKGLLWHRLEGVVPALGEKLTCHLDVERRETTSRAHTALHLLLHALGPGGPRLVADPEVKGGGTIRLTLAPKPDPRARVGEALARVKALIAEDRPITPLAVPRDLARHRLMPQPFVPDDPFPGPPDLLHGVEIAGVGALPCDGVHVTRTSGVHEVSLVSLQTGGAGAVLLLRAR